MRRKRLELAILAFGVAFVGLLAVFFRSGSRPASPAGGRSSTGSRETSRTESAVDGDQPTAVLSGFDYTESVGEKPLFRIRSERTIGFGPGAGLPPNRYALEKVSLTVYPEEGEPVTVHADRAQYDDRTKAAVLSGNVAWTEPRDGALGETEKIEFRPGDRVLVAPSALHLTRGTFDVRAASGAYDVKGRVLRLAGPIRGSGTGQGSGGLSSLEADSGEYRREESVVLLIGKVSTASAKGDRLACDRLLLKLSAQGREVEWARALGGVRGSFAAAPAGAPAGARPGAVERTYSASEAALFFDPSGEARALNLLGSPASVVEPARQLAARSLDLEFASGRPVAARASGAVRLRSDRGNAESQRASASFAPAGDFETLELEGDVRVEEEGRSGRASRVVDLPSRGVWLLTGNGVTSATVEEGSSKVSAARIEIDRNRKELRAEGRGRAVFAPRKDRPAQAGAFLGDPSRPAYGKADRIVLDQNTRLATLSGGASLWQESSSLFADDITLNDTERTAAAVGRVRAVFSGGATEAKRGETPSVVTARRLLYRESESSATFEENVTIERGAWRAVASRGTAFFGKDRRLDRIELAGAVTLLDRATGRRGTADRAVDYPREGRTVLSGSPARVSDSEGNRVAGSTLTITGRGQNVEVTAPDGGRTETIHKTKSD